MKLVQTAMFALALGFTAPALADCACGKDGCAKTADGKMACEKEGQCQCAKEGKACKCDHKHKHKEPKKST